MTARSSVPNCCFDWLDGVLHVYLVTIIQRHEYRGDTNYDKNQFVEKIQNVAVDAFQELHLVAEPEPLCITHLAKSEDILLDMNSQIRAGQDGL